MKKKTKKVVSYKSLVNFVIAKVNQLGIRTRKSFGIFYIPQPYSGVVSRGRESSPPGGALAARSASLIYCRDTNAKNTPAMNIILPQEAISPDSFFRALIELDPLGYRETLLLLTDP